MTGTAELMTRVRRILSDIAPDVDASALDPSADIREAAEIDSVDFLNFVAALYEATGVDVPERDYSAIRTLDGCVAYLTERAPSS